MTKVPVKGGNLLHTLKGETEEKRGREVELNGLTAPVPSRTKVVCDWLMKVSSIWGKWEKWRD
jgi:hypothetical protein